MQNNTASWQFIMKALMGIISFSRMSLKVKKNRKHLLSLLSYVIRFVKQSTIIIIWGFGLFCSSCK